MSRPFRSQLPIKWCQSLSVSRGLRAPPSSVLLTWPPLKEHFLSHVSLSSKSRNPGARSLLLPQALYSPGHQLLCLLPPKTLKSITPSSQCWFWSAAPSSPAYRTPVLGVWWATAAQRTQSGTQLSPPSVHPLSRDESLCMHILCTFRVVWAPSMKTALLCDDCGSLIWRQEMRIYLPPLLCPLSLSTLQILWLPRSFAHRERIWRSRGAQVASSP